LLEKEYDGLTNCKIKSYNIKSSDIKLYGIKPNSITILNYNAHFENKLVGATTVYITDIILSDNNYVCGNIIQISNIKKKYLTINFKNTMKEYDGTINAKLEIESINNIINENVYIENYESYYYTKNSGESILFIKNIKLNGINSNNYIIEDYTINTSITKKKLTYTITLCDKKFDGTNVAFINLLLTNTLLNNGENDDVFSENYISLFDNEIIGLLKPIIINNIVLGGSSKYNYYIDKEIYIYGNINI